MKLILTRHGETIENQQGIIQGHLHGRLSDEGIEQAKKLAKRLKDEKIDVIYSSDLARSSDTTKEIAKFHPNIPIYFVKELREKDYGSLTGKNGREFDWSDRYHDVESGSSMQKRAKKILDEAYEKYSDKAVLFVGHNRINKALISVILNRPASYIEKIDNQLNTAVNIFEIKNKKHKVYLMNCIKHLR